MPIRPEAARIAARGIVAALSPEPSDTLVDLAASIIVNAVDADELRVRKHAIELQLLALDVPDSLGG